MPEYTDVNLVLPSDQGNKVLWFGEVLDTKEKRDAYRSAVGHAPPRRRPVPGDAPSAPADDEDDDGGDADDEDDDGGDADDGDDSDAPAS